MVFNLAHDRHGARLITRLYLGDNYGKDDEGSPLKVRQFLEVNIDYSYILGFQIGVQDVIWLIVSRVPGNAHLRRDQLFQDTDSYYSLTQGRI